MDCFNDVIFSNFSHLFLCTAMKNDDILFKLVCSVTLIDVIELYNTAYDEIHYV